jgi:hypothetical protein
MQNRTIRNRLCNKLSRPSWRPVATTTLAGSILNRVLEENSQKLSVADQQRKIDGFIRDSEEQAKRRKAGQHDDDQATELLKLLPDAFGWIVTGSQGGKDFPSLQT